MEREENSQNYTSSIYKTPDGVPADTVIFTITKEQQEVGVESLPEMKFKVLMIKRKKWPYKGCWALPGGFSNPDETLLNTAKRELKEETNIDGIHVEHIGIYSTPDRDPRGWIISSAYYALVNSDNLEPIAGDDAGETKWFKVKDVLLMERGNRNTEDDFINENKLAFDHDEIIRDAVKKVREKMLTTDIAKEFLPKAFTVTELYTVIQAVVSSFEEPLPNFRRKILKRNIIQQVESKSSNKYSRRPAQLYSFTGTVPELSIYK
jgi:8-oxo-dGTP diphosphatase